VRIALQQKFMETHPLLSLLAAEREDLFMRCKFAGHTFNKLDQGFSGRDPADFLCVAGLHFFKKFRQPL
jgi:hypothetical protein